MAELPAPLVPADLDVRDLDSFMLNVERLMMSELVAISTGDEFKAALLLWCRAWKQLPAASLPNDDRILASFSLSGSRWSKLRAVALHGFVLCADGRLYHPFLAAEAIRAFAAHKKYLGRRAADRKRLEEWRKQHPRSGNAHETPVETSFDTGVVAYVKRPM